MPEEIEQEYVEVAEPTQALARIEPDPLVLSPVMNLAVAKERLEEFQRFVRGYLIEGEDYGTIQGTARPSLLQPGADKLSEIYGLAVTFPPDRQKSVEDWKAEPPLFDYASTCVLINKRNGQVVAEGLGSCNSYEGKYRWREKKRSCPKCSAAAIIKGKDEFGGGWLCWKKQQGCGAKFKDGDEAIEGQAGGKVPNDDMATQKNTILKMANKRAKIAAVITATRSSGIFTQDVEDIAQNGAEGEPKATEVSQVKRKAAEPGSMIPAKRTKGGPPVPIEEPGPFAKKNQPSTDDEQWLRENS